MNSGVPTSEGVGWGFDHEIESKGEEKKKKKSA